MKESFKKQVLNIAIPVALQSMLQSSFDRTCSKTPYCMGIFYPFPGRDI